MSYTKLFGSILDSTIWQQPDNVRLVWITMLAMKDQDGIVEASIPGLAKRAGQTIEATEAALAILLAPDAYSRTKDHDGRRIAEIDGGWQVINHLKYRDKLDLAERREKKAKRQQRWKDKTRGDAGRRSEARADTDRRQRPHTEADAEAVPEPGVGVSGSSPSASGATGGPRRDLVQPPPIERGSARAAGVPVPPGPPLHDRAAGDVASDRRQVPQPPPPDVARNQALVKRFVDGINAARARVQLALGLRDVRPISHMHGSETTLLDRLRGVANPEGDIDHVIRVAEEEAVDTGELRWLGWSTCEIGAWRVRLAGVPGSRKKAKPIGAPQTCAPPKFPSDPPRAAMSEEERAEVSRMIDNVAKNADAAAADLAAKDPKS